MPVDVIEAARRVIALGPPMRLAVLFGSHATGAMHPGSDVDVAILPVDESLALASELDLAHQLSPATGREVDLVQIDRATPLVRWQIAKHGRLLFAAPRPEWTRFVAAAASEHADLADSVARAATLFRRRLAKQGT